MAVLRTLDKSHEYPILGESALLGRDKSCDVVVHAEGASRRHALIVRAGDAFYVEDLNSSNGTFLNGRKILQRTRLDPNDRLEIPGLAVTFHLDDPKLPPLPLPMREGDVPGEMVSFHASIDMRGERKNAVKPELKLRAILEISKNLATTLELERVLPRILDGLFCVFNQADRGFILFRDENSGDFVPKAVKYRRQEEADALSLSKTIVDHVVRTNEAVLSTDARHDGRFNISQSIRLYDIRSIMCVPLLAQNGHLLGIVQIDTQNRRNPFQQEDLDVLVSACDQAARAMQLAELHRREKDWEAAKQIQHSFLPAERPGLEGGWKFFDYYASAQHVGGDYYDYIPLPGNRLAVAVGDVAGKGVAAALLMARLSAAVRFCLATETNVPVAVRQLSNSLIRRGSSHQFITFVVIVIDLATNKLTLVNAGHPPPLLCRAGSRTVQELGGEEVGPPLAVIDYPYEGYEWEAHDGDCLMVYTDGVTEARNRSREFFGQERLLSVVQNSERDPVAAGTAVLQAVNRFAGGRPASDDITLVAFGKLDPLVIQAANLQTHFAPSDIPQEPPTIQSPVLSPSTAATIKRPLPPNVN